MAFSVSEIDTFIYFRNDIAAETIMSPPLLQNYVNLRIFASYAVPLD